MVLPHTDDRDASNAARHENSMRDQAEVSLISHACRKQKVANLTYTASFDHVHVITRHSFFTKICTIY
jgi:predicted DNA-binding transcriptional regulator YafY